MSVEIFDELLLLAVQNGASDIVIKSDKPGMLRINGGLEEEIQIPVKLVENTL